jgi:hypothetical protein
MVCDNEDSPYPGSIHLDGAKAVSQLLIVGIPAFAVSFCVRGLPDAGISFGNPLRVVAVHPKVY